VPWRAAVAARDPAKNADAHPPLRPDAPHPHTSDSSTATRIDGSARSKCTAVHKPV